MIVYQYLKGFSTVYLWLPVFLLQSILEATYQIRHLDVLHLVHISVLALSANFVGFYTIVILSALQPLIHLKEIIHDGLFESQASWVVLYSILTAVVIWFFSFRRKEVIDSLQSRLSALKSQARELAETSHHIDEDLIMSSYFSEERTLKEELKELVILAQKATVADNAYVFVYREGELKCICSATDENCDPAESGIIYDALSDRSTKFHWVEDGYIKNPGYYSTERLRSLIASPIVDEQIPLGVICVESIRYRAFSEKDQAVLDLIAKEATRCLGRQRMFSQIKLSYKAVSMLHEHGSALAEAIELDEILKKIVESSEALTGGTALLLWRTNSSYRVYGTKQLSAREQKVSIKKLKETLLELVRSNKKPLYFSDLGNYKKRALPLSGVNPKSMFVVPIVIDRKVHAMVAVYSAKKDAFNQIQRHLLEVYLYQASESASKAMLHEEIKMMAFTDGLTGLYNHRRFQERLQEELKRASRYKEPLSLILLDIDHFKKVNDTYGHPAGDAVLKRIAELISRTVREIDFPARYGGEEFALIILKSNSKEAKKIAERLRKKVEQTTVKTDTADISVTLSLGIASYPEDAKTREELIDRADQALYRAKQSGRNRTVLYEEIR